MEEFKRPRDVESFIQIWGWMDDVVCKTKKGKALAHWKIHSVPLTKLGTPFYVRSRGTHSVRQLSYDDIISNRFWYKSEFAEDMKNYKRVYGAFVKAMVSPG